MGVLLFLFGTALAAGLYFVLADLLKIPRLATERALISAGRRERSLVKALEALILGWALKASCPGSSPPSIRSWQPAGMCCGFWKTTRNTPGLTLVVSWMC